MTLSGTKKLRAVSLHFRDGASRYFRFPFLTGYWSRYFFCPFSYPVCLFNSFR